MPSIRTAILMAADHIERNPASYSFTTAIVTPAEGDDGCLLGWIAFYAGEPAGQYCGSCGFDGELPHKLLGVSFSEFFDRCWALACELGSLFTDDAPVAAAVLRLYAERFHASEKQEIVPWSAVAWQPREVA